MNFNKIELAYCGLYCLQCSFRTTSETNNRKHLESMPERYDAKKAMTNEECACEGCKGENVCGPCDIQDCAVDRNLVSCADCNEFPCSYITRFENDGVPHHYQGIQNLRMIQENGYEAWFQEYKENLQCSKCGARQSWYYMCDNHT